MTSFEEWLKNDTERLAKKLETKGTKVTSLSSLIIRMAYGDILTVGDRFGSVNCKLAWKLVRFDDDGTHIHYQTLRFSNGSKPKKEMFGQCSITTIKSRVFRKIPSDEPL